VGCSGCRSLNTETAETVESVAIAFAAASASCINAFAPQLVMAFALHCVAEVLHYRHSSLLTDERSEVG
jgi:hypothetical protein